MDVIIQLTCGIIIIVLGSWVTLRKRPKLEVDDLAFCTLLVVIVIILNRISVMLPLFGYNSFKVSFEQLPLVFVGIFFGPFWGFWVAIVSDTLSFILNPQGAYFLGFLLSRIVITLIASFWFSKRIKFKDKTLYILTQILVSMIFVATLYFVLTTQKIQIQSQPYLITMPLKIGLIVTSFCLTAFLLTMIHLLRGYKFKATSYFMTRYIMTIVMIEIIVQMLMTPLWLQTMYHIPFYLNLFVRIVSSSVMVPLKIFIGLSLYRIFPGKLRIRENQTSIKK